MWRKKEKKKSKREKKDKKGNCSLILIYGLMPSKLFNKAHLRSQKSSFSSSTPVFIARHNTICYRICLWPAWASCPSCIPSQSLAHLQLTHCRDRVGKRESFDIVQALFSSSPNIGVFINAALATIQNTASPRLLWKKLTPSQTDTVQGGNFQLRIEICQVLLKCKPNLFTHLNLIYGI